MFTFAAFSRLRRTTVASFALAACLGIPVAGAHAFDYITNAHDDIQITGNGSGGLLLNIHNDDTDVSADPATTGYGFTDAAHLTTRNAQGQTGSAFDILGVGLNTPYYLNTQTGLGGLIIGLDPGKLAEDFAGIYNDSVTLRLVGFSGPGTFTMFRASNGNPNTVFHATTSGIDPSFVTAFGTPSAGHTDYDFAFSTAGIYNITFQATGTLTSTGQSVSSAPTTFRFAAGDAAIAGTVVVPEAGTFGLLLGGGSIAVGVLAARRRRFVS